MDKNALSSESASTSASSASASASNSSSTSYANLTDVLSSLDSSLEQLQQQQQQETLSSSLKRSRDDDEEEDLTSDTSHNTNQDLNHQLKKQKQDFNEHPSNPMDGSLIQTEYSTTDEAKSRQLQEEEEEEEGLLFPSPPRAPLHITQYSAKSSSENLSAHNSTSPAVSSTSKHYSDAGSADNIDSDGKEEGEASEEDEGLIVEAPTILKSRANSASPRLIPKSTSSSSTSSSSFSSSSATINLSSSSNPSNSSANSTITVSHNTAGSTQSDGEVHTSSKLSVKNKDKPIKDLRSFVGCSSVEDYDMDKKVGEGTFGLVKLHL